MAPGQGDSEHIDALLTARQNYEAAVAATERLAAGVVAEVQRLGVAIANRDAALTTPEQQDSDLLFPAITGGFRAPCVLNKPMVEVAEELRLGKKLTQKGLRRTFNDLQRSAEVDDIITRSISGHLTPSMQELYSTVNGGEQRKAIAKVIRLFSAPSGEHGGEHQAASGEQTRKAS